MGLVSPIDIFEISVEGVRVEQPREIPAVSPQSPAVEHVRDESSAVVGLHVFRLRVHVGDLVDDARGLFREGEIRRVPVRR